MKSILKVKKKKKKKEWIRVKTNQKLNSEILLLSLETGSNTGYNRYRTPFSTGYSSVQRKARASQCISRSMDRVEAALSQ